MATRKAARQPCCSKRRRSARRSSRRGTPTSRTSRPKVRACASARSTTSPGWLTRCRTCCRRRRHRAAPTSRRITRRRARSSISRRSTTVSGRRFRLCAERGRRPRVTVVTSGHLSTCPRMLKAADALAAADYDVRVVATLHEPWATDADAEVRSRRAWPVTVVDYRRHEGAATYWTTGVQQRAARSAARASGVDRVPFAVVARAFGRVHGALVRAMLAERSDLIYG